MAIAYPMDVLITFMHMIDEKESRDVIFFFAKSFTFLTLCYNKLKDEQLA